jgi:altronate dehydratase
MGQRASVIVINEKDNVATALESLEAGSSVPVKIGDRTEMVKLISYVPKGHKFALTEMDTGAAVIKYGEPIGESLTKVVRGEHIHVHNMASRPRGGTK